MVFQNKLFMAVGLRVDTMLDSAFKVVAQTLACTVHGMHYWICNFTIINRTSAR